MTNGFETHGIREQPMATGLAAEHFNTRLGLRDQRILLQRFDRPILRRL